MSTQQQLIEDAYASFGILDEETGLEPAMLQRGLRELHRVVNRLYDDGVSIPYILSSNLSNDSGCDDSEEEALINTLALKLMSSYANDRSPSATLVNTAKNSIRTLRNQSSVRPNRVHPSTLPKGSGNNRFLSRTFYSDSYRFRVVLSNGDPVTYNGEQLYFDSETFA